MTFRNVSHSQCELAPSLAAVTATHRSRAPLRSESRWRTESARVYTGALLSALALAFFLLSGGVSASSPTSADDALTAPSIESANDGGASPEAAERPRPSATEATPVHAEPAPHDQAAASDEAEAPAVHAEPAPHDQAANPPPPHEQQLARQVDAVLSEAARDLSLSVDLLIPASWAGTESEANALEGRLLEVSRNGWAIAPQLERHRGRFTLRLLAVPPGATVLQVVRVELQPERLELQTISALRALTKPDSKAPSKVDPPASSEKQPSSKGRAVLAVGGALAGGYFGFSLEHIGGSGDPRLVYPLMTLGAAVGVGASLVISEEWDITPAEAWYTLAAITWPTAAGILIAQHPAEHGDNQFLYGAAGTVAGLTLGTIGINLGEVEPAGALLTHSSAFFGSIFGALAERLGDPAQSRGPTLGMGVGMAAGTLIGGWGATFMKDVPSSRIVYINLATVLGMLTGAAAASPAIVGKNQSQSENRIWYSATAAGGVLGAVVGSVLTRNTPPSDASPKPAAGASEHSWQVVPTIMAVDFSDATSASAVLGLTGSW